MSPHPDLIEALLARCSALGVRLWLESGQVRYDAPAGLLTAADLRDLVGLRGEIAEALSAPTLAELDSRTYRPDAIGPRRWRCGNRACSAGAGWWRSIHGTILCARCAPPEFPELVSDSGTAADAPYVDPPRDGPASMPPADKAQNWRSCHEPPSGG